MLHTVLKSYILFIKLCLKKYYICIYQPKFVRRNETVTFPQAYYVCTNIYPKIKDQIYF